MCGIMRNVNNVTRQGGDGLKRASLSEGNPGYDKEQPRKAGDSWQKPGSYFDGQSRTVCMRKRREEGGPWRPSLPEAAGEWHGWDM